jgi:hypothetical protein
MRKQVPGLFMPNAAVPHFSLVPKLPRLCKYSAPTFSVVCEP